LPATLSNSLRVAKLTNCQSILPETTSIGQRRNWPIACRSRMRKADRWQHSPGSRHWRRQRHSLGSFGPWNKRGHRRSVLLRAQNRSPRAECRSPHSKSRHRPIRRLDARHSSGRKPVEARRQALQRPTDAIDLSSLCSFLWSPRVEDVYAAKTPLLLTSKHLCGFIRTRSHNSFRIRRLPLHSKYHGVRHARRPKTSYNPLVSRMNTRSCGL
jgi:hypothetical protein